MEPTKLGYSINEVARITGLGRSSIYRAINNDLLGARKLGRRTIILATDLGKFLVNLKEVA